MEKWEALLPEGWQKLDEAGLRKLHGTLTKAFEAKQASAISFEDAQEVRAHELAIKGIVGHVQEQTAKVAEYQEIMAAEAPAFPDAEAEATAAAEAAEAEAAVIAAAEEAAAAGGDGGGDDVTPPTLNGEGGEDEGEDAREELTELLAKVASLGLVVKTQGGEPVTQLDQVMTDLHRDGWRTPVADGIGANISDEAFAERFANQMISDTPGQHKVASLYRFDPKAEKLGDGSADFNTRMIHNTPEPYLAGMASAQGYDVQPDPKLAAFCGPAETIYEIPDCVDDSRMVRGLFRRIPAKRGSIEFFRTLGLADVQVLDGVAEAWTDVDQGNIAEGNFATYKKCAELACISTVETQLNRLYTCVKVEILMDYGSPEIVQMYMSLISAAHARAAEEQLLCTIADKSIWMTWAGNYGSTPALAAGLIHLSATGKFYGRLKAGRYMALIPEGMQDKMEGIDAAATGYGNYTSLRELLGRAGIGLQTLQDACDPLGAGDGVGMPAAYTSAPAAPGSNASPPALAAAAVYGAEVYPVHLITPADGFFFELPKIDTGLVSSPELARQNSRQLFMETFEGLDKNGCSPWYYIQASVCHNSDRAGFNTVACA